MKTKWLVLGYVLFMTALLAWIGVIPPTLGAHWFMLGFLVGVPAVGFLVTIVLAKLGVDLSGYRPSDSTIADPRHR